MKKISRWLIVFGLILVSVPLAGRCRLYFEQRSLFDQYRQGISSADAIEGPSIMDEGFLDEVVLPEDLGLTGAAADSPPDGAQGASSAVKGENVLGTIEIPAIDSSLLLLEGSSSKELRYGAGHVKGTSMPGEMGNCAVAGHRNYTFGTYFSRLDEVEPGDTIRLEYNGEIYLYTAEESFTVLPADTWVLDPPQEDEGQLTLITCAPKGSNTHRLIVRGSLDETKTEE